MPDHGERRLVWLDEGEVELLRNRTVYLDAIADRFNDGITEDEITALCHSLPIRIHPRGEIVVARLRAAFDPSAQEGSDG